MNRGKTEVSPHLTKLVEIQRIDGSFYIDETDIQTIRFVYPQLFKDEALVQEIRLEIGSLAAWTPLIDRVITPFVAEQFPHVFKKPNTIIRTVEAKRTFGKRLRFYIVRHIELELVLKYHKGTHVIIMICIYSTRVRLKRRLS